MTSRDGVSGVFDFLSEENCQTWKGILSQGLQKIQKQVQPKLEIEEDAVAYLEGLIFRLLAQMCAAQPHTLNDVDNYVKKNFADPIDSWALSDAKMTMSRALKKKVVFVFPVERLFPLLQKEVFGYKIEINLVLYIMAILDYVAADILKLAGNFVKNLSRSAIYISATDIHVSMSADQSLQALFQPLQGGQRGPAMKTPDLNQQAPAVVMERDALRYNDVLRQTLEDEKRYIRLLNLILKVFMEPFLNKDLFLDPNLKTIILNLKELHEISAQLVVSLEECIEMAGEDDDGGPKAGITFEEILGNDELDVYLTYANNYMMARTHFEELVRHTDVVSYFKSRPTKYLLEAMKYLVPKSLDEPCYHLFHYFDAMDALQQKSTDEEDSSILEETISMQLGLKSNMKNMCSRFLKTRGRDENSMFFGKREGYQEAARKLAMIQQKIGGWEGPEIQHCCTEYLMEGSLGVITEGKKSLRARDKNDRHVFLLDGLIICCKAKNKTGAGVESQYRLKEKINMRKVTLIDLEDSEEIKFSFCLQDQIQQTGLVFVCLSRIEKNDWMAVLTHLVTKSTFERLLDIKLREEEEAIPPLTPPLDRYSFAEPDSDSNIIFDEKDEGVRVTTQGPLIKAGTIYKLVERLTYHEYADPAFLRTFLMTYRSFCQPGELLDLLISRYHIPSPLVEEDDNSKRDPLTMKAALKKYRDNYTDPIQLRVLNVLRQWVDSHYYDFERDSDLLEKLKEFVGGVTSKKLKKWVSSINRGLRKRIEKIEEKESKPVFDKGMETTEWHIAKPNDINEYNLLSLHPVELARQLTLIQSEYFKAIHPSELVDASWMKDSKKESASPHLLRLNRFETTVSNWLVEEIVLTDNYEERVALVSRLVDIMEAMWNLNNFAGMFVINAALESASVFRLKNTLRGIRGKRLQLLEDMKKITTSDKGFKRYKDELRNITPPCVPFLGMYMTWIVFLRDGAEDKVQGMPDNFINFKKRRKIADVLQEIITFQYQPYALREVSSIRSWILSQDPVGDLTVNKWEDKVFDQSRLIEPKEGPVRTAPRKYQFSLAPPQDRVGALNTLLKRKTASQQQQVPEDEEQPPASPSFDAAKPPLPPKPPAPGPESSSPTVGEESDALGPPALPYKPPPTPPRNPIGNPNKLPLPRKPSTSLSSHHPSPSRLQQRESSPSFRSSQESLSSRGSHTPSTPNNDLVRMAFRQDSLATPTTPKVFPDDRYSPLPTNAPRLPPRPSSVSTPTDPPRLPPRLDGGTDSHKTPTQNENSSVPKKLPQLPPRNVSTPPDTPRLPPRPESVSTPTTPRSPMVNSPVLPPRPALPPRSSQNSDSSSKTNVHSAPPLPPKRS